MNITTTNPAKKKINCHEHIFMHDENIMIWREQVDFDINVANQLFNLFYTLSEKKQKFNFLLDLSKSNKPNAEQREFIRNKFEVITPKINHVAVYTNQNILINIAMKFIMGKIGFTSFSVHKDYNDALNVLKDEYKI